MTALLAVLEIAGRSLGRACAVLRVSRGEQEVNVYDERHRKLERTVPKNDEDRAVSPHNETLEKLLWLMQDNIAKKWTKPVRNRGEALMQLTILFPDKLVS
jgi:hypothetical protein